MHFLCNQSIFTFSHLIPSHITFKYFCQTNLQTQLRNNIASIYGVLSFTLHELQIGSFKDPHKLDTGDEKALITLVGNALKVHCSTKLTSSFLVQVARSG